MMKTRVKVVGLGALHLLPVVSRLPENTFSMEDERMLWSQEDSFDLIHTRVFPYDRRDWAAFYKQAYERLNPGGWLEQEALNLTVIYSDSKTPPNSDLETLARKRHGTTNNNEGYLGFEATEGQINRAGFINVKKETIELPVGPREEFDPTCHDLGDWLNGVLKFLLKTEQFAPPGLDPFPLDLEKVFGLEVAHFAP
ncbi:hypothetical protein LX36DRAFT_112502 [Colletotrichum falcatum]|nr:hypothetical protein LX36DRAFT_112502 [Colletotrichum falcatum]